MNTALPDMLTRALFVGALFVAPLAACSGEEEPLAPGADNNGALIDNNGNGCSPDARECLDAANFRVCRPDGQGYDYGTCPPDAPCERGLCRPSGEPGNNGQPGNNGDPNNNGQPSNNGEPSNNGAPNNNGEPGNNGVPDPNQPCEPFARACLSDSLVQICRADGSGYDQGVCAPDRPCRDGYCDDGEGAPGTCLGGARECLDSGVVRVCRPDGTAWERQACPSGQFCEAGACRALNDCMDRDRDGYGTGSDCLGPDCDDDNYQINPGGFEVCGDGIDQDCDLGDAPCACDPLAQDCPGDRLKCDLNREGEFECRTDGVLVEGEPCGGIPSNCARGLVCLRVNGDTQSYCQRMCSPGNPSSCPGDALCGATLQDHPEVGVCTQTTDCDPVDSPQSCPQGTKCQPISDRDAACFDGGGALTEGATCDPQRDLCASGLTCITFQGDNPGSRCQAWCKPSRGNADCAQRQGRACSPLEFTFTFNGQPTVIRAFGICN